jgi:hypothetical protein
MLEALLAIGILELIATIIIVVDFGPETARKIKSLGRPDRWFK